MKLHIGALAMNKKAVEILQDFGFKQYSTSVHMHLGEKLETERVNGILVIGAQRKVRSSNRACWLAGNVT